MADDETAVSPAWAAISSIEGFFTESQYLVWRWFGGFQWRENVVGDLAEIGDTSSGRARPGQNHAPSRPNPFAP